VSSEYKTVVVLEFYVFIMIAFKRYSGWSRKFRW